MIYGFQFLRGKHMRVYAILGALAVLPTATASYAATISPEQGEVKISVGQGFEALAGSKELRAGGQVVVSPGGTALISYGSCQVRVGSNRVWTVQEKAPCADGSTFIDFTGRMGNTTEESSDDNSSAWLIGLGVAGVAAAVAIAVSDDDDNNGNGGNNPNNGNPVSNQ